MRQRYQVGDRVLVSSALALARVTEVLRPGRYRVAMESDGHELSREWTELEEGTSNGSA